MKELDVFVLLAVFNEMLGYILWLLLATVLLGCLAFVALLIRERGMVPHRLVRSQALGILGGVAALILMVQVSSSGYTDAGGPADWFLIFAVFGLGLIGSAMLFYTVWGWWLIWRRPGSATLSNSNRG